MILLNMKRGAFVPNMGIVALRGASDLTLCVHVPILGNTETKLLAICFSLCQQIIRHNYSVPDGKFMSFGLISLVFGPYFRP